MRINDVVFHILNILLAEFLAFHLGELLLHPPPLYEAVLGLVNFTLQGDGILDAHVGIGVSL